MASTDELVGLVHVAVMANAAEDGVFMLMRADHGGGFVGDEEWNGVSEVRR